MIRIEGLSKSFGETRAVDNLSLHVGPGEILGLLGPNGAGKTTTMRCLCGITPYGQGEIVINGVKLNENPMEAKRRLAFVPSDPRLFEYLTVREHLGFFARLYAAAAEKNKKERAALIENFETEGLSLIEELDLSDRADFLPGALSRGMKQKLMIACAMVHKPDILVFDEPFTGLDPHAIRKVRRILTAHIDQGAAVIISSHLLGMVEDMISNVLILSKGRKVVEGTVDELRAGLASEHANADLEEIFIQLTAEKSDREEAPGE